MHHIYVNFDFVNHFVVSVTFLMFVPMKVLCLWVMQLTFEIVKHVDFIYFLD